MKTAETNRAYYLRTREIAYCGSVKDHTWSVENHMHVCCQSRKALYHRQGCYMRDRAAQERQAAADLKEKIRFLKREKNLTSLEVAEEVGLPLTQANKLYITV